MSPSRDAYQSASSEDIVSNSAQLFTGHQTQIHERRAHPRVLPRTLIYVACGESNGGMVLNVSDDGMAISMAIPVGDEAYSTLHVRMNGLAQSVEVHGRMAWTTKSKKRAGIQLVDVSEEQRGQIREWLAQEGVRDVNLLPRVSEPATCMLPMPADAAISSTLSPVSASCTSNSAVAADRRASLLAGFGGTAPEFLGPAQNEGSITEDAVDESPSLTGSKPKPEFVGFREKEWDLASVTMVPRKRSKPEGLSALGLLLLWIAIPSFGIGIIVGRRPLQQWLARAYAVRTNTPRVVEPGPQIINARDESPAITGSDIDAVGQSIPDHTVEASTNSVDIKTSAATKSFVSTPAFVDTKLLNSMSTQELQAIKSRATVPTPQNSNAVEVSKLDSNAKPNSVAKDSSSAPGAVDKPVTGTKILAASATTSTNPSVLSTQSGGSKDKSIAPPPAHDTESVPAHSEALRAQSFSKQIPNDPVSRSTAVDSGMNASAADYPSLVASNVTPARSSATNIPPTPAPLKTSSAPASGTNRTATEDYSAPHQNYSGSRPAIQSVATASGVSSKSADHSVATISTTAGNSNAASSSVNDANGNNNANLTASRTQPTGATSTADTAPRIAPNVNPNMDSVAPGRAATKPASRIYASGPSRSAAPTAVSNVAPVNAQSPLHGVMLVARKNNESFLLRLPVESVAGGRSVSVQMQRFVMVPAESRWHRHGPIAKLTVGELLTPVAANQVEMAGNARPGDAVTVRAFVDKNGIVEDLKPVSGRFALMPRVMHDIREWQFDQTLVDGKPVESELNITVEFRSGSGPQPSRGREIQAQNSYKP
jgi:hypothetical protein